MLLLTTSKIQLKIMCGFCRITDLGISHFNFFKQKLKLKSIYMFEASCSSGYTEHNKIEFAFLDFSTILYGFYKIQLKYTDGVRNTFLEGPWKVWRFTTRSLVCTKHPEITWSLTM
jgi:hypothetical protein